MKLLIEETHWWGLKSAGKEVKNFEFDLENIKLGEKVVVGGPDENRGENEPKLYFVLVSKDKNKVELELGGCLWFSILPTSIFAFGCRKDLIKNKPFWLKAEKPFKLQEKSMDDGYSYTILLKK